MLTDLAPDAAVDNIAMGQINPSFHPEEDYMEPEAVRPDQQPDVPDKPSKKKSQPSTTESTANKKKSSTLAAKSGGSNADIARSRTTSDTRYTRQTQKQSTTSLDAGMLTSTYTEKTTEYTTVCQPGIHR